MKVSKFRNFLTNKYASWFDKWHRYKEKRKKERKIALGWARVNERKCNASLPLSGEGSGGRKLFTREKWKIAWEEGG